MKTLLDISLHDLLPENLEADETVSDAATAIDPQLKCVAENANMAMVYYRLDDLTSEQLDHLAVQYNVTPWDSSWTKERKLLMFKAMLSAKSNRGTAQAVKDSVAAILDGYSWTVTEWWEMEPPGDPYTFEVGVTLVDGQELSAEDQYYLEQVIYESKSIRSHNTMTIGIKYTTDLYFAGVLRPAITARIISTGRDTITSNLFMPPVGRPAVFARL